jgi:hypothetical protein
MVFMSADAIRGDVSLVEAAKSDIAEMAVVGSGGPLNTFVQVHGLEAEPRRFRVEYDTTWQKIQTDTNTIVPLEQRETRRGRALLDFIRTSLVKAGHDARNPYHYSMLVLWGHAYDFGVGRVRTASGAPDALDFTELSVLLETMQLEVKERLGLSEPPKLDVAAFDACDVATLELAYELAPFVRYLLGSQVGVPIPGWPYDRVLERLRVPQGRMMAPPEFGVWAVRRFIQAYAPLRSASLSMLNLERVTELVEHAASLTGALDAAITADPGMLDVIAEIFDRSLTAVDKPYVDVADFCLNLARESGDLLITSEARALGDLLIAPPSPYVNLSNESKAYPFVVAHGRNAGDTAKLNGVSLYAPNVALDSQFRRTRLLYDTFRFAYDTRWSHLVHDLAESR